MVELNPRGGYIEAEVTYNKKTGYSGTQYNHGYSNQDWVSGKLRSDDAQKYYIKLKAQGVELHKQASQEQ